MGATSRPIPFLDFLPAVFRRAGADEGAFLRRFLTGFEELFEELEDAIEGSPEGVLRLRVISAEDERVTVEEFRPGPVPVPAGTAVTAVGRRTTLAQPIPANARDVTTVELSDEGVAATLRPGQMLELRREGEPHPVRVLRVLRVVGTQVAVARFDSGPRALPAGSLATVRIEPPRTTLAQPIPASTRETANTRETTVALSDRAVAAALARGDELIVHAGGLPDLFHFDTTPPPQLKHSPATAFAHLAALAAWLDLPLRPEKPADWNRRWLAEAVRLHPVRATVAGLEAALRAWLAGDLLAVDRQTGGPPLILTDLTRRSNEVTAAFQLDATATLGVDTVLGEGPPHAFVVDLPAAPDVAALRHPDGLEALHRAARALLDREKPAWTLYELRLRGHGMELAPGGDVPERGFDYPYAQIGRTTLLWDRPWVFEGRE